MGSAYSPHSTHNFLNSKAKFPVKPMMSPHFGQKQEIDQSQVIPRVFNFPNHVNRRYKVKKRPNTYFSDLARANDKFSNTSRRYKSKNRQDLNYTGINFQSIFPKPAQSNLVDDHSMMKDHLNGDLPLDRKNYFSSDSRKQ